MSPATLPPEALRRANDFEAIAADAMDGAPPDAELARLVAETKGGGPAFAAQVAEALSLMAGWIAEDDKARRFTMKLAVLRRAAALLREQE